ncbi:MAG: MurR/RpiR family transcriptional regulator [Ruminococcus flavefaciens]|nr:MurR/RpiR family transcriptional regulator [Ruminococcus flavefaciens]
MKSALLRLRESQDSMSATERSVSDYVLSHQGETMELSIHQLAEKTFASPSTVIRMCQRIGFAGYKEFRQAVTCEVAVRRLNQEQERKEITYSDSLDEIVDKVTYKNIMSLEETKNLIDTGTLQECVDLLKEARTVLLFGMGASLCAAHDLNLKLIRLNKPCQINDDWHVQMLQARNATKEDLAIVVSYSGETVEVIECMKVLRERGVPVIAITRQVNSPVTELSDYRLYTSDSEATFRSGAMASRISQLNIIDILFTAYANTEFEYCLDQLSRTHHPKPATAHKLGTA